jgi:hypothetical protein
MVGTTTYYFAAVQPGEPRSRTTLGSRANPFSITVQ